MAREKEGLELAQSIPYGHKIFEHGYGFMNPEQEHNHGRFQVQGFLIAAASPALRTTPGAAADLY
jgi:hypothetical protein